MRVFRLPCLISLAAIFLASAGVAAARHPSPLRHARPRLLECTPLHPDLIAAGTARPAVRSGRSRGWICRCARDRPAACGRELRDTFVSPRVRTSRVTLRSAPGETGDDLTEAPGSTGVRYDAVASRFDVDNVNHVLASG